jgi:hypothetical protein
MESLGWKVQGKKEDDGGSKAYELKVHGGGPGARIPNNREGMAIGGGQFGSGGRIDDFGSGQAHFNNTSRDDETWELSKN